MSANTLITRLSRNRDSYVINECSDLLYFNDEYVHINYNHVGISPNYYSRRNNTYTFEEVYNTFLGRYNTSPIHIVHKQLFKTFYVMPGLLCEIIGSDIKTLISTVVPRDNFDQFCINFTYNKPYFHLMEVHINNNFTKNRYKALYDVINKNFFNTLIWCKFRYVDNFRHLYNFPKEVSGSTFMKQVENQNKYGQFVLNKLANAS